MISWWFDVNENSDTDANNLAKIKKHKNVFSRVMPFNGGLVNEGNVSEWWNEDAVRPWFDPLKEINGLKILPYFVDIDNSTQMHLVYDNMTAVIADVVAIAKHYGFDGWFIDYEDEYPPDTNENKTQELALFLTTFADALHKEGMELTICVASWSELLSDFTTLGKSSVDELQNMDFYSMNETDAYEPRIDSYFDAVGDVDKAGVGIGIYYDGVNYPDYWPKETATKFLQYVKSKGGTRLDVFRLVDEGKGKDGETWPREDWWWELFEEFMK